MNKLDMAKELQKRAKEFALKIIKLVRLLPRNSEADIMRRQLVRSATSVASNYRATCRGRSKKEFTAKIGTVVEEADETAFWLEMIRDAHLLTPDQVNPHLIEAEELLKIFSKSRHTALNRK